MLTPNDKFPEGKPPPGCGMDGPAPYKPAVFGGGGMPTLGLGMGIPDIIRNKKEEQSRLVQENN